MARTSSRAWRWRRPLGLALAALLTVTLAPVFAQGDPPPEPLVPNIEPEELVAGLAANQAPWTLSEQEAVEAALAAMNASGEVTPPDGALLDLPVDATAAVVNRLYLPLLVRTQQRQDPNQQPTPTPEPPRGSPADVAVTIWPKPSILVARGAILEYEIRLANRGNGDAREVKVTFPYNRNQVALAYTSLNSRAGDWVSAINNDSFTVTFGRLGEDGKRTGKVFLRVNDRLAQGTLLDVRARYTWRDGVDGGGQAANWTPVLVGSGPSDAPYIWVRVDPDRGAIGAQHRFFTNRFLPGETVTTWVNLPGGGVRALSLRGTANSNGEIELRLRSTDSDPDLGRGTHQLVLYGQRSGLTGVATFIVQ